MPACELGSPEAQGQELLALEELLPECQLIFAVLQVEGGREAGPHGGNRILDVLAEEVLVGELLVVAEVVVELAL